MNPRTSWNVWLVVIFGAVTASFVAATAFAQRRLAELDRAALDIADNAAPSIELLAAARGEARRVQLLLRDYVDRKRVGEAPPAEPVEQSLRAMNQDISDYLRLPVFPDEQSLWGDILRTRGEFDQSIEHCRAQADGGNLEVAEATSRDEVSASADALGAAISRSVEFDARHSHDLALEIKRLRKDSTSTALALDGACVLLTLVGAFALRRTIADYAHLTERHQQLIEERASELEQFAGRIAHDILSPLGTVALALHLTGRTTDDETRARNVARGTKALEHVKSLVHGLLEFARAGAKPAPSTCTDLGSTLADLFTELKSSAAESGTALEVKMDVSCSVGCNAGVLTSLVSNLARNAIKYIDQSPVKRIEIRAIDRGPFVRVEVEDTGPGLAPGLEDHVFEPYVRGQRGTQSGIGLGLATVKRLAEAHGGRVGVHSRLGDGCTFWFELPKVQPATAEVRVEHDGLRSPA